MPKTITPNQLLGEIGEAAVRLRFLNLGFQFDARSRLEAGADGIAEVMDKGKPLARMIAVQVKATDSKKYSGEDDTGFSYLLRTDDLAYWRGSNRAHHMASPSAFAMMRLHATHGYEVPKCQGANQATQALRRQWFAPLNQHQRSQVLAPGLSVTRQAAHPCNRRPSAIGLMEARAARDEAKRRLAVQSTGSDITVVPHRTDSAPSLPRS